MSNTGTPVPSTKQAILNKSTRLFAKHGYSARPLSAIAAEVGIRKPSLYNHYASKEAILGGVFEFFRTLVRPPKMLNPCLRGSKTGPPSRS